MNSYFKLVNFEMNRFFKLYMVLIAIIIIGQIGGILYISWDYMNNANELMIKEKLSAAKFVEMYGPYSMEYFIYAAPFILPIMLSICGLWIYVFFIWYRDWFGKGKFAYRLLMLPIRRSHIYFAKLTMIVLCTLGLVALQVLLLVIEVKLLDVMIDDAFLKDVSFYELFSVDVLAWLYPRSILEFFVIYGLGIIVVAIVFMGILLERSYRLKGIVMAIVYVVVALIIFIAPMLLTQLSHPEMSRHRLK